MVMLDFICMGSAEQLETRRERKIQNEDRCLEQDSYLRPAPLDR